MYHRVADLEQDSNVLAVTPNHFDEHMELLRKKYRVLGIQELVTLLGKQLLPNRAVVVTFDDGYLDNLMHAVPVLIKYGMPGTIFVTSGYVGQEREFWWDELEQIFLGSLPLPGKLTWRFMGVESECDVGSATMCRKCDSTNGIDQSSEGSERRRLYDWLHGQLITMGPAERAQSMEYLFRWSGIDRKSRPLYRCMNETELLRVIDSGLVDIGAHTVTHPSLASLPVDMQREEIRSGKARLEQVLGRTVNSFCYPFGGRGAHYASETVREVRESGFSCACTTVRGVVRHRASPFELPRVPVPDIDGDAFARYVLESFIR